MEKHRVQLIHRYRAISALAGWAGLGLLFSAMTAGKNGAELVTTVIRYFSYFTILSNLLVALIFSCSWLCRQSGLGRLLFRPTVRAGAAIYITVTGLVFVLILNEVKDRTGVGLAGTILLHYVVPVLVRFDWGIFVPKGELQYRNVLSWLIFPLVYAVYTLVHGGMSGFYPYPFVNVLKLGYAHVLLNCFFLVVTFVILGLLVVAVDRRLSTIKSGLRLPC